MSILKKMNKEELIKECEDQMQIILELQTRLESSQNGSNRKAQVLRS